MTKVSSQLIGQTNNQSASPNTKILDKIGNTNKHMQSKNSMLSMTKGGANIASIDSMNPYMSNKQLPLKDVNALSKKEAEKVLSKHLDSHQYYNPIQN